MDEQQIERARVSGREWTLRGRMDRLIEVVTDLLAAIPSDAEALHWAWLIEMQRGDLIRAQQASGLLLTHHPEADVSHRDAAITAVHVGDVDRALRHARRAIEVAPTVAANHVELGHVVRITGDITATERHALTAVSLGGCTVEAMTLLAWCAFDQGQVDRVHSIVLELLRVMPDDSFVLSTAGMLLFNVGRRSTGLAMLREVLRANPADYRIHLSLAHGYISRNDWTTARQHLREALRLKPELDDVRRLLRMGARTPPDQMPPGWSIERRLVTWTEDGHMIHEIVE